MVKMWNCPCALTFRVVPNLGKEVGGLSKNGESFREPGVWPVARVWGKVISRQVWEATVHNTVSGPNGTGCLSQVTL